jgi:hypothetical protein
MNINEYEALENLFENGPPVSDTMKEKIRGFLTYEESKTEAFLNPFNGFTEILYWGLSISNLIGRWEWECIQMQIMTRRLACIWG